MKQPSIQSSWNHAALVGISMFLLFYGIMNLISADVPNREAFWQISIGLVFIAIDSYVFGFRTLIQRCVAAGIVLGAIGLVFGIFTLAFGVAPRGTHYTAQESAIIISIALRVLIISGIIKALFYSKVKMEDMTLKNNSSNKSSEPT